MPSEKELRHPDIIDNRAVSMADVLNSSLERIEHLDVSSGYFDLSGYDKIRHQLQKAADNKNFTLRLLLGKNAINPPQYETFEEYQDQMSSVRDVLDAEELGQDSMSNVADLIRLLRQDNVHVRHNNQKFNHSKCYILGIEGAIVGSSNFTHSGFEGNDELNVGIYQTSTWVKIKEWYDRMWDKALDAKGELIQVLEQSKFGIPPEPYDVYIKMLFEMYKPALLAMESEAKPEGESKLANFQRDAVSNAMQTVSSYGGVIIADATGLGKTHIGIEIIRQKLYGERKKVLLVAPAQVLDSVWNAKLREAGILIETVSMEKLGRKDFLEKYSRDVRRYARCNLVVIDESQNFRSKGANRRENLMRIMSLGGRKKKQAVLLSATPINNSVMDLYYQLSIITGQNDAYFWDIGIPNLNRHMKSAATKEGLGEGLKKIHQILNTVMVRRTRLDIKEIYGDRAVLYGKPVRFPDHDYQPITYNLSDTFGDIYKVLADAVESLTMAPYGVEQYNNSLSKEEKNRHRILASLQVVHMLKRFESSTEAVKISIGNKIRLYERFQKVLEDGRIFSVKQFNKIMIKLREDEDDRTEEENEDSFMSEILKIPTRDAKDYDVETIRKETETDLRILRSIRDEIEKISGLHEKFNTVAKMIYKDRALESESKKVLIFTEYADTAKYLRDRMEETFKDKEILLITGMTKPATRQEYIGRFAPVSNLEDGLSEDKREADILISTEVLAEGQNLQDCNYVINYDLPWNPMRIVQRVGRIDRLTSKYETIHSRACYPEEKLEVLLELVGKLVRKINTAGAVIGLDGEVLGEKPEGGARGRKSIFDGSIESIAALAGADGGSSGRVIKRLEREDALMPDASFNEINRHIKDVGIKKMKSVPMGRRSGKHGTNSPKAILAYVMERPRKFYTVAVYPKDKTGTLDDTGERYQAQMIDDSTDAMRDAACGPDEPRYLPDDGPERRESFEMLLGFDRLAREAIKSKLESDAMVVQNERSRRQQDRIADKIEALIVKSFRTGTITEEEGEAVFKIIKSDSLGPWESRVKEIYSEHSDDVAELARHLKELGRSIGIFEDLGYDEYDAPVVPDVTGFKLAGAMFISE